MVKLKSEVSRGILNPTEGTGNFGLSRYHPGGRLAFFVEHYWIVRWDLRGRELFEQDVLSHLSVHLVFEKENTRTWGVVTGKFTRKLERAGQVLGVKFRPGGFYPFYQKSISGLTDKTLPFSELFDDDVHAVESEIFKDSENKQIAEQAESFLIKYLPQRDARVSEINEIMQAVMKENLILKVDDLLERFDLSKRTLQRLFRICGRESKMGYPAIQVARSRGNPGIRQNR